MMIKMTTKTTKTKAKTKIRIRTKMMTNNNKIRIRTTKINLEKTINNPNNRVRNKIKNFRHSKFHRNHLNLQVF
jgi:hypothetical protein